MQFHLVMVMETAASDVCFDESVHFWKEYAAEFQMPPLQSIILL